MRMIAVEKYIKFSCQDFFETRKPFESGILIMNIPYGLRLDEQTVSKEFVNKIGDHLKHQYKGWRCGVLLPEACPYKHIGLKPTKRATLLNGSVPVKFLVFDMY